MSVTVGTRFPRSVIAFELATHDPASSVLINVEKHATQSMSCALVKMSKNHQCEARIGSMAENSNIASRIVRISRVRGWSVLHPRVFHNSRRGWSKIRIHDQ